MGVELFAAVEALCETGWEARREAGKPLFSGSSHITYLIQRYYLRMSLTSSSSTVASESLHDIDCTYSEMGGFEEIASLIGSISEFELSVSEAELESIKGRDEGRAERDSEGGVGPGIDTDCVIIPLPLPLPLPRL